MPLAFHSRSHGPIAFGFFNIESDMLLLEHYFFFADDFCRHLRNMAAYTGTDAYQDTWPIYEICQPEKIGDLMGAIHGIRFTGFIGKVYQHFPFPSHPKDFKQKPYGADNRTIMLSMIEGYAVEKNIPVAVAQDNSEITMGLYRFDRSVFHELIIYVWQGGYPRWQNDLPPDYVLEMKKDLLGCNNDLFKGIDMMVRTSTLEK